MRLTCKTCGSRYSCSPAEHDATECTGPPERTCVRCSNPHCRLIISAEYAETYCLDCIAHGVPLLCERIADLETQLASMKARLRTKRKKVAR